MREEWGVHILGRGVLSPWVVEPSDSVYFSPPKQAVAPSELNFWTHSLQIHCNGPGLKTETLQIYMIFFKKKDNYNMLLTLQLELFSPQTFKHFVHGKVLIHLQSLGYIYIYIYILID